VTTYYARGLSAERLERCYTLAPPRMQRYLEQEIAHLLRHVRPGARVLELGCGYGRVAERVAQAGALVTGIDVAGRSLELARQRAAAAGLASRCDYRLMDALALDLPEATFDVVACVQNGIGAFRVDALRMAREAWRVLKPQGLLLLSTYADAVWPDRLAWFEAQAAEGLVGALDYSASLAGTIVCRDGFRSTRATAQELRALGDALGVAAQIEEVDASSLWCTLRKPASSSVVSTSTGAADVPSNNRSPSP